MKTIIFILVWICSTSLYSQSIRGRVVDSLTGTSLAGVSVTIGSSGVLTNNSGQFSIHAREGRLTVTYVGYFTKAIPVNPSDSFFVIPMLRNAKSLEEVTVSSGAEKIIRKAIEGIPLNYPDKPFVAKGILRQYQYVYDSTQYYRFYKNDAVIHMYYPSYNDYPRPPVVALVENKLSFNQSAKQIDTSRWIQGYLPYLSDFAYFRKGFIDPNGLHKYRYNLTGKTTINDRRAFVINFSFKSKKYAEGTLFIDTATYAFVGANYNMYKVVQFGMRTINRSSNSVEYSLYDGKWIMSRENRYAEYEDKKYFHKRNTDYVMTGLDTVDTKLKNGLMVIPPDEQDIAVNKIGTDSSWAMYQNMFSDEEDKGGISLVEAPQVLPKNEQVKAATAKSSNIKNWLAKNLSMGLGIISLPINLNSYPPSAANNFGNRRHIYLASFYSVRVWKNVSALLNGGGNFSKFNKETIGLGFQYSPSIIINHKYVHVSPFAEWQRTGVRYKDDKLASWHHIQTGLIIKKYITGRLNLSLIAGYAYPIKTKLFKPVVYKQAPFVLGLYVGL